MAPCSGITKAGSQCSLAGSDRFGGSWCHHHCSGYFKSLRDMSDNQLRTQQDKIRDLESSLIEMAKRGGNLYEVSKLEESLTKARQDLNKVFNSMIDIMKKENDATRELVREESAETRETVCRTTADVKDTLSQQNIGIAKLLMCVYEKVDMIADPTVGMIPARRIYEIASGQTYWLHRQDICEIIRRAGGMLDDEIVIEANITRLYNDLFNINNFRLALDDENNITHTAAIALFKDVSAIIYERLSSLQCEDIAEKVLRFMEKYDPVEIGDQPSRKRRRITLEKEVKK